MKIFAKISWLIATILIFFAIGTMIFIHFLLPAPYPTKIANWLLRLSIFFTTQKEGKEDPKAQMFLLNHQSDLDIAVIETTTSRDLAWVAKKELFDIPFFGWSLKLARNIPVERQSKTSLIKLLRNAKDRLKKDRVIAIFPEGTRSTKGKMLPFKSGAKIVADKCKLRVQPVVLMQTAKYYDIKRFYYVPGKIKVIYLDSFDADENDENWLDETRQRMQKVYDDELANNPRHR